MERHCELANRTVEQLYKVCTPCLDDHQFEKEEMETVGGLSKVCCRIVLQCLFLARIGRLDILWSVNKLARAVTNWTRSCDRRLARLISYIHNASNYRQCWHVDVQHNIADWDSSMTQTLLVIWKTQTSTSGKSM